MRSSFLKIASALLIVLSSVSCGKKDKVIPRGKMAEIYADMFVMDQWVVSDMNTRREADTTLVYEPVFRKYGYTSDDYRESMAYYIQDPDRYARILRKTAVILEERLEELKKEQADMAAASRDRSASAVYSPERIFFLSGLANKDLLTVDSLSFYIDSTGGGTFMFDVQKGYDTLFVGPELVIPADDTLSVAVDDTVSVALNEPSDTLKAGLVGAGMPQARIPVSGISGQKGLPAAAGKGIVDNIKGDRKK